MLTIFKIDVITTLKKIVNEAWSLETFDTDRLAKYMRCLFQYSLTSDVVVAEELLDQVIDIARDAESVRLIPLFSNPHFHLHLFGSSPYVRLIIHRAF